MLTHSGLVAAPLDRHHQHQHHRPEHSRHKFPHHALDHRSEDEDASSALTTTTTYTMSSTSSRQDDRLARPRAHNATEALVHRLPHELLADIFELGLAAYEPFTPQRSTYIASLSSVCSLWHSLATSDPRLWTYVSLSDAREPISSRDEERVGTHLARSGQLPLHVLVEFNQGVRTPSLSNCLHMLKRDDVQRRCESIRVETNCVTGWEDAFPIRGNLPMLKRVSLTSSLDDPSEIYETWSGEEGIAVSLFGPPVSPSDLSSSSSSSSSLDGGEPQLPKLEELSIELEHPHLIDLWGISPETLRRLTLRAFVPHPTALDFVQRCTNLESLVLELKKDDEEALDAEQLGDAHAHLLRTIPGALFSSTEDLIEATKFQITTPSSSSSSSSPSQHAEVVERIDVKGLKELEVRGPSATILSSIVDAPSLETLRLTLGDESHIYALSYFLLEASGTVYSPTSSALFPRGGGAGGDAVSRGGRGAREEDRGPLFPALRKLVLEGEYYYAPPAEGILGFLDAHPDVEELEMTAFVGTSDEVLRGLSDRFRAASSSSSLSRRSDESEPPMLLLSPTSSPLLSSSSSPLSPLSPRFPSLSSSHSSSSSSSSLSMRSTVSAPATLLSASTSSSYAYASRPPPPALKTVTLYDGDEQSFPPFDALRTTFEEFLEASEGRGTRLVYACNERPKGAWTGEDGEWEMRRVLQERFGADRFVLDVRRPSPQSSSS